MRIPPFMRTPQAAIVACLGLGTLAAVIMLIGTWSLYAENVRLRRQNADLLQLVGVAGIQAAPSSPAVQAARTPRPSPSDFAGDAGPKAEPPAASAAGERPTEAAPEPEPEAAVAETPMTDAAPEAGPEAAVADMTPSEPSEPADAGVPGVQAAPAPAAPLPEISIDLQADKDGGLLCVLTADRDFSVRMTRLDSRHVLRIRGRWLVKPRLVPDNDIVDSIRTGILADDVTQIVFDLKEDSADVVRLVNGPRSSTILLQPRRQGGQGR